MPRGGQDYDWLEGKNGHLWAVCGYQGFSALHLKSYVVKAAT